jgi:hypothetical protein
MLLCRTWPLPANQENHGLQSFFRFHYFSKAPKIARQFCRTAPIAFIPCMQKFAVPFSTSWGLLFFLIFSEAYLLTGASLLEINYLIKP